MGRHWCRYDSIHPATSPNGLFSDVHTENINRTLGYMKDEKELHGEALVSIISLFLPDLGAHEVSRALHYRHVAIQRQLCRPTTGRVSSSGSETNEQRYHSFPKIPFEKWSIGPCQRGSGTSSPKAPCRPERNRYAIHRNVITRSPGGPALKDGFKELDVLSPSPALFPIESGIRNPRWGGGDTRAAVVPETTRRMGNLHLRSMVNDKYAEEDDIQE